MSDSQTEQPVARPRKHPQLWQSYQVWTELTKLRTRFSNRKGSAERGASNLDAQFYEDALEEIVFIEMFDPKTNKKAELGLDKMVDFAKKIMISYGEGVGPIWGWLTQIKGLKSGGETAKLLAQIDDIGRFDTIAKLWRFAGMAVFDGKAERPQAGEIRHYNTRFKSVCYMIGQQFIYQQTPIYVDIYYAEKARQRVLHPEPVKEGNKTNYTDLHIDLMARRKMMKQFLADLWLEWRRLEGLPVTEPYKEDADLSAMLEGVNV